MPCLLKRMAPPAQAELGGGTDVHHIRAASPNPWAVWSPMVHQASLHGAGSARIGSLVLAQSVGGGEGGHFKAR